METTIITAPELLEWKPSKRSIFLAGSIEMGKAEDWQQKAISLLASRDTVILNPRRRDWDSSWKQTIDNPQFNEQVNWELDALNKADFILMYLQPGTYSPISLLELGLYATTNKIHLVCPEGFWRKGNVDIVCKREFISQYNSIEEACENILSIIN